MDRKVSDYVRSNVHITSSGMFNPALLSHVLEVTTPDRLLFSTDEDRDKFTAGNACALFGIDITSRKEQR